MKILRVAQAVYPEVSGGGAYHVHALSRDQAAMGHDVTVLTIRQNTNAPQVEHRYGYTVKRIDPSVSVLGNNISIGMAQQLIRIGRFDAVHAHSHLYFSSNLTALRCVADSPPLVITNHGLHSQSIPQRVSEIYLRTIGRWTFNRADTILCYTKIDKTRVQRLGVNTPIKVVTNGVDIQRFTPNGSESNIIDHDGPTGLFVGRLVDGKNPLAAADAVSRLSDDLDVELYVAGDGPLRSSMSEMDNVTLLGELPYDRMPALYRSADFVILPSRTEGFPRTIIESLSSGVPVITSDLTQIQTIANGACITVPVGDIDGLAEAIVSILRSDYGTPRDRVIDEYEWEQTVDETTEVIKHLSDV